MLTIELMFTHRVSDGDPSGQSVVLPQHEYWRIKMSSRVLTDEERRAAAEARRREKQEAMVSEDPVVRKILRPGNRDVEFLWEFAAQARFQNVVWQNKRGP